MDMKISHVAMRRKSIAKGNSHWPHVEEDNNSEKMVHVSGGCYSWSFMALDRW